MGLSPSWASRHHHSSRGCWRRRRAIARCGRRKRLKTLANIRRSGYWAVVGRLKPGVSLETAQAEMTAISQQLAVEHPRTNEKTGALVRSLRDHLVGNVELAVAMLGGAVALVLLIASSTSPTFCLLAAPRVSARWLSAWPSARGAAG